MNSHIQLNAEGNFLRYIPAGIPIEWDENNYCTAFALEADGKAEQFRVFPFYATSKPAHDPITQAVSEIDPVLVDGNWTQQWQVTELSPEEIQANQKALVPSSVTMRQARLALLGAGLLASVDAAIDSLPSPQKEAARIEWEYATEVQRSSGLVPMMVVALGLDDAALDALFIGAAAL